MKFLVGNQLPQALARFLCDRGFEASHVMELGLDEADDVAILRTAISREMVLISKDADFLDLVHQPGCSTRFLWVRIGNCRRHSLIQAFERALPGIVSALDSGAKVVEVR